MTAVELAARLARKQVSAREVMTAHLARIERVNPKINAIVTLVADQAMANAAKADETIARGGPVGPLHGLPVAHKDLVDTAGIRTTRGSPFFRDHVPTRDALDRGADSRGWRRSPWARRTRRSSARDRRPSTPCSAPRAIPTILTKTCGGSSGGAATAVAARLLPIADGSDTGGSLRNPPGLLQRGGIAAVAWACRERWRLVVAALGRADRSRERSPIARCFSA